MTAKERTKALGHVQLRRIVFVGLSTVLAAITWVSCGYAADVAPESTADRLVNSALQAESQGDLSARATALQGAVKIAPENKLARWQLGQVQIEGKWKPVEDIERAATSNSRLREYETLRGQAGETLDGQLKLARWCDSHRLKDEARFHWTSVLAVQPDNAEAQKALGVRWYNGRLLSREQIAEARTANRTAEVAQRDARTLIAKLEREFDGDFADRTAALTAIRSLKTPESLPAFEENTLGEVATDNETIECRLLSLAMFDAIGGMQSPAATAALAKHAVLSPLASVRKEAVARLKDRSMYDYVPILLDGLQSPVVSWFGVTTDDNGSVHYRHAFYREGPFADWAVQASRSVWRQPSLVELDADTANRSMTTQQAMSVSNTLRRGITRNVRNFTNEFGGQAYANEQRVAQVNTTTERMNDLITPVLSATTGQDFSSAREWWNWWKEHNGYESSLERPVNTYAWEDDRRYTVPTPIALGGGGSYECFVRGTPVWTKSGLRAIESLRMGDLVLSQDVRTGELAYKPVVGTTSRAPSPTVTLSVGNERITATTGHAFWVAGKGWLMAKELTDGTMLHGVKEPTRIAATAAADDQQAYNLVVADFATYFVGRAGVLVHDNTMERSSTASALGVAEK